MCGGARSCKKTRRCKSNSKDRPAAPRRVSFFCIHTKQGWISRFRSASSTACISANIVLLSALISFISHSCATKQHNTTSASASASTTKSKLAPCPCPTLPLTRTCIYLFAKSILPSRRKQSTMSSWTSFASKTPALCETSKFAFNFCT